MEKLEDSISQLLQYIDSEIIEHYYDHLPTIDTIPASKWITEEEEKEKHVGERFICRTCSEEHPRFWTWTKSSSDHTFFWLPYTKPEISSKLILDTNIATLASMLKEGKNQTALENKTCKYCKKDPEPLCKDYLSERIEAAYIRPGDRELEVILKESAKELTLKGSVFFTIFNCPMCGEKLKEADNSK